LSSCSYPLLFVDNECGIGLATSSVFPPKKSKSIDMRLDWLKERASQQFFRLVFLPGLINPADFFTKILPVYRHIAALPFLHDTPYPTFFAPPPPPPHTPSSLSLQSSGCSLRQGLPYHSLPLISPHFVLPSLSLMSSRIASNTPMLFPGSFPILKQGTQRTHQPRTYRRMLVF
jgi:hypothetical protein